MVSAVFIFEKMVDFRDSSTRIGETKVLRMGDYFTGVTEIEGNFGRNGLGENRSSLMKEACRKMRSIFWKN